MVILTRMNEDRLEATRKEFGDKAVVVRNDAADPAASADLSEIVKSAGGIDGLWLNAAFAALGPPEEIHAWDFDRMMATNVRGPMLQLAKLSPLLRPGTSIVLTSSSSPMKVRQLPACMRRPKALSSRCPVPGLQQWLRAAFV
ncbi:SDR family oxidoreductase [Sinorhizobium meliloti]|uniref:SDR family oxidoreductase n=1 Tax=Rhizobium meliloti TaxID=382 RepID=UPI003B968AF6